jgi:hypothetical protein
VIWWVNAEQPTLLAEQFAELAVAVRAARPPVNTIAAASAARSWLQARDGWLLVLNNATEPAHIREWIPGGTGHVLITSRHPTWIGIATPIWIDTFDRAESVALLRDQTAKLSRADADRIAGAVGDLPLALAQAAGLLTETGLRTHQYLQALDEQTNALLERNAPATYSTSLAATVTLSSARLREADPAASDLLRICTFLAPEPIPVDWFDASRHEELPRALAASLRGGTLALRDRVSQLVRYGLARTTVDGLIIHRLTAAIVRSSLTRNEARAYRTSAEALVVSITPRPSRSYEGSWNDVHSWPLLARLLPHVFSLNLQQTSNAKLMAAATEGVAYLLARGDVVAASTLSGELYQAWLARLGPDDVHTLAAAHQFAKAQRWATGQPQMLLPLMEDTYQRRRKVLGANNIDTLASAGNLAIVLEDSDVRRALTLRRDTLTRIQHTCGRGHPFTLREMNNLANTLLKAGEPIAALPLAEEAAQHQVQTLGRDHPDTLDTVDTLALILHRLGNDTEARKYNEEALLGRQRVLGKDHPDTLISAARHARDLRAVGRTEEARRLEEDTLQRRRRVLGADHPDVQELLQRLQADQRH